MLWINRKTLTIVVPCFSSQTQEVSGVEIIEFRNAFTVLTKPFFFSTAFGPVGTRQETIISAEHLFRRLVFIVGDAGSANEDVAVNLMDMTSMMFKGCKKPEQLQHALEIIDLLKPDANGCVTLVDFASAIDEVYREVRSLEYAVKSHSHVEKSYEKVLNIVFYIFLFCVVIIIYGFNPLVFIASISAIWLSFAFMIGSGVSQQFEGVLMVLVRQPYDAGDSIAMVCVLVLVVMLQRIAIRSSHYLNVFLALCFRPITIYCLT